MAHYLSLDEIKRNRRMIDAIREHVLKLEPLYASEPSTTQLIRQANLERRTSKEERDKKCQWKKVQRALEWQKEKRLKAKTCGKKIPKVEWNKINLPMLLAQRSIKDVAVYLSLSPKTVMAQIKQLESKSAS